MPTRPYKQEVTGSIPVRRYAEVRWRDAIREMHAAGFSLREIAADAGVDPSHIAALLDLDGPDRGG